MSNHGDIVNVALLQNFDTQDEWGKAMIAAIIHNFKKILPEARIEIFAPVRGDQLPDPNAHDLIILSGGPHSLAVEQLPGWITDTLEYVRVASRRASTKIIGICWGHLAINKALGGQIGNLDDGSCVGVKKVYLNEAGREAFPLWDSDSHDPLSIQKFHMRTVTQVAPELYPLAADNEILTSEAGNILSFQGHPEVDSVIANLILDADTGAYTGGRSERDVKVMRDSVSKSFDIDLLFQGIGNWVRRD